MLDPDIMRRIQAGSRADLKRLYMALGAKVFRLSFRIVEDRAEAEDLTQDVFMRVSGRGSQYSGGDPAAWVLRIAGNLARDRARSSRRRAQLLTLHRTHDAPAASDIHDLITLRRLVNELDDEFRIIVLLHVVEGFTHSEIAASLGIAEGTSRSRLSRALATMRHRMLPPAFAREIKGGTS